MRLGGSEIRVADSRHLSVPVAMVGVRGAASFWAVPGALAEGIGTWHSSRWAQSRWAQVVRGSARRRVNAAASSAAQGRRASSRKVLCWPLRTSPPAAPEG
jgi:hypothetical protein